jgi:hypothetical protein
MTISLVDWHIALNRVSGAMVLKFHKAEAADLRTWAAELRRLAMPWIRPRRWLPLRAQRGSGHRAKFQLPSPVE